MVVRKIPKISSYYLLMRQYIRLRDNELFSDFNKYSNFNDDC